MPIGPSRARAYHGRPARPISPTRTYDHPEGVPCPECGAKVRAVRATFSLPESSLRVGDAVYGSHAPGGARVTTKTFPCRSVNTKIGN